MTLFPVYTLLISLSLPISGGVHLDRKSTYTFTGFRAHSHCIQERTINLNTKVLKGDKLTVGECVRK